MNNQSNSGLMSGVANPNSTPSGSPIVYPPSVYPNQFAYPPSGYPNSGYPPSGYPNQFAYPPSGFPNPLSNLQNPNPLSNLANPNPLPNLTNPNVIMSNLKDPFSKSSNDSNEESFFSKLKFMFYSAAIFALLFVIHGKVNQWMFNKSTEAANKAVKETVKVAVKGAVKGAVKITGSVINAVRRK